MVVVVAGGGGQVGQVLYYGGLNNPYWYVGPVSEATKCSTSPLNFIATSRLVGNKSDGQDDPAAMVCHPWMERNIVGCEVPVGNTDWCKNYAFGLMPIK